MAEVTIPMFDVTCKDLRAAIKKTAEEVSRMHVAPIFTIEEQYPGQYDEMHANITLSYRHLEDATMRLGKVIQAYDQGKSVYDK